MAATTDLPQTVYCPGCGAYLLVLPVGVAGRAREGRRKMLGLEGFTVQVSPYLVGAKRAVKMNGKLHVSPAMWDLMRTSTPEELQTLLASIGALDIDDKEAHLFITDKRTL